MTIQVEVGDWVTVGDSDHVWQVWDDHARDSHVWLADGVRWVAAPRVALARAEAPTAKPAPYTNVIVRTARKIHACSEDGCRGIWPGDRYVLTKAFPGHDSGIADGTATQGPRPVAMKLCAIHARNYETTNVEGIR